MIGIDRLVHVTSFLDRVSNVDPGLVGALRDYLNAVYDSAEYQQWLAGDQYLGDRSFKGKPSEPFEASQRFPTLKHLLTGHALVSSGKLQVKIDRHFDRVHITDGFWVPALDRVFPTCDESEIVCNAIRRLVPHSENLYLLDPACGSGHHSLGLKDYCSRRASFDVSGRALAFARFNSILNGDSRHLVAYGDIKDGICEEAIPLETSHMVFAVNMPFAIPPERSDAKVRFSFAQDGGNEGSEFTLAALSAIRKFMDRGLKYAALDAVVLCYSLGKELGDGNWSWSLESVAREHFPDSDVSFELLQEERLWRVNGKKEQENPMPLEKIVLKADCRHTFSDSVRDQKRDAYSERVRELKSRGYSHLGYGIIHIRGGGR